MIHISFDKRERSSENYSSRHGANFAYLIRISKLSTGHENISSLYLEQKLERS